MTTTKSTIRDGVKNRLKNIPSTLTDSIIEEYVESAHIELENALGVSFATSAVPDEYTAIIEDMALVNIIDYMLDDLVEKSVSIGGDVSINYSDIRASLEGIRNRVEKAIDKQMNMLGTRREFAYTEP